MFTEDWSDTPVVGVAGKAGQATLDQQTPGGQSKIENPKSKIGWLGVYLRLSKTALVSMVVLTMAAGFLLANRQCLDLPRFLWAALGTAFTAAGANAFNQWHEAQLDKLMRRTRGRPLPARQLGSRQAFCWAACVSAIGLCVLACGTNALATVLAVGAEAMYVLAYTPLKRRSTVCTLVGAVCGAIPPLIGWAAASGRLEHGAWLLAVMLFLWQIPHVLALAWLHRADLRRADFRVLPQVDGTGRGSCRFCLLYSAALVPLSLCLPLMQVANWRSAAGVAAASVVMAILSFRLCRRQSDANAQALFRYTLAYLPLALMLMIIGG
jgi:protoheme IX farnesyltransferase